MVAVVSMLAIIYLFVLSIDIDAKHNDLENLLNEDNEDYQGKKIYI